MLDRGYKIYTDDRGYKIYIDDSGAEEDEF